jgi:hypothetical protein
VPPADLEVGGIVGRRHLDGAGAEGWVHRLVGHDRNQPVGEREPQLLASEVAVAIIFRMHRDGSVAEHGLRAGGRDGEMALAVRQRIADVPDVAVHLLLLRLLVGEGGEAAGTPVDDVVPAVDQALLVQPDEDLAHRAREILVQREVRPRPVGRAADGLELVEDPDPGLAHVGPHPLDERLPAEVEAGQAFLGEEPLDHVLGRDPGVIGARHPERAAPAHPLEPDEDVLHRVVESVTDMELRRDIGRRHLDDVRLPRRTAASSLDGVGVEQAPFPPPGVERGLDLR